MHQQDGARALQPPRRLGEAEELLHRPRHEPGLTVKKEEGDHADERRQHRREGDQRAQGLAPRELEPLEQKRERDADGRGQRHTREGDPHACPQRLPLARPARKRRNGVAVRRVDPHQQDWIQHEPREQQRQGRGRQHPSPLARGHRGSAKGSTFTASRCTRSPTRAASGAASTSSRSPPSVST